MSPQPKKVLTGKGAYVFSVKEGARGFSAMSSSLSDKLSSLLDTSHQLKKVLVSSRPCPQVFRKRCP
ncbi:hypothetical protein ACOSQ2_031255 [Xanthoceras sorbifolium]